jgi:hypothetical protein
VTEELTGLVVLTLLALALLCWRPLARFRAVRDLIWPGSGDDEPEA